jgi:hypothetical protein
VAREFDSPWKESLEQFLEQFTEFFFQSLHAAIDWTRGYESLDNELREIMREAESGTKTTDELFRVYLHNGENVWLLIHLEVQSQPKADFEERVFVSYYRIFDRYNRDVVSIAVLGDEQADWRPNEYRRGVFGTKISLEFSTVKLLDWAERIDELETSSNPIALIVLSHLESVFTNKQPERRRQAKWRLIRRLYELGWTQEQFRQMYRLIDWFLELPDELQRQLRSDVRAYEEENKMPYRTSDERMAREEGRQEGRQEGLQSAIALAVKSKFGIVDAAFVRELQAISDPHKLEEILGAALDRQTTIDQLRSILQ